MLDNSSALLGAIDVGLGLVVVAPMELGGRYVSARAAWDICSSVADTDVV